MIVNADMKSGYSIIFQSNDLRIGNCPVNLATFSLIDGVFKPSVLNDYGLVINGTVVDGITIDKTAYFENVSQLFSEYDLVYSISQGKFVHVDNLIWDGDIDTSNQMMTRANQIPQLGYVLSFGANKYRITGISGNFQPSPTLVGRNGYGMFTGNLTLEMLSNE